MCLGRRTLGRTDLDAAALLAHTRGWRSNRSPTMPILVVYDEQRATPATVRARAAQPDAARLRRGGLRGHSRRGSGSPQARCLPTP